MVYRRRDDKNLSVDPSAVSSSSLSTSASASALREASKRRINSVPDLARAGLRQRHQRAHTRADACYLVFVVLDIIQVTTLVSDGTIFMFGTLFTVVSCRSKSRHVVGIYSDRS